LLSTALPSGTAARRDALPPSLAGHAPEAVVSDARPAAAPDLSALFEETADLVHRTAWRITRSADDAEDVLQAVFLHLLRFPPSPWPDNAPGYVHRAAVNASFDVLRRRRRRPETSGDEALSVAATRHDERDALSRLDERRLAEKLSAALPCLSPLEAEVFSLRFFEEKTNQEIAELLGKTANHVGVLLHSARTKLKSAVIDPPAPITGDAP
jgi:RNA polymerase sigma factor (sigma-70 family)